MVRSRYKILEPTHPHFFNLYSFKLATYIYKKKRGYVDEAKHWRYSSARDCEGIDGLIEVERFWYFRLSYVFPPRTDGNEKKIIEHLIAIKIDDEVIPINPSNIQKQILDVIEN